MEKYYRNNEEIDPFTFLSLIGKHVDRIVGAGADEMMVHGALMRAQEMAATEAGLETEDGRLFIKE